MTRALDSQRPVPDAKRTHTVSGPLLRGWVPIGLIPRDEERHEVEWLDMSGVRFSEPFFTQTLARVRDERPDARAIVTGIEELLRAEGSASGLEPSGFIFHTSRCGSTLVANSLKALDDSTVVAEAPVLDSILGLFFGEGGGAAREMFRLALLRAAVGALGQRLCGDERRYFVKFTNWGVMHRRQIARLWPNVPWLFLYRDPVEVIVSNMKKDAGWMRIEENPGEAALLSGVSVEAAASMSREEHCARVVGRCCEAAAAALDEGSLLVNYDELSPERLVELIGFFGVEPTKEESERVRRVSGLYSKDTGAGRAFSSDSDSKRAAATDAVRAAAERWAAEPYELLERLRREQAHAPRGPAAGDGRR
jgi:hypothetical protein